MGCAVVPAENVSEAGRSAAGHCFVTAATHVPVGQLRTWSNSNRLRCALRSANRYPSKGSYCTVGYTCSAHVIYPWVSPSTTASHDTRVQYALQKLPDGDGSTGFLLTRYIHGRSSGPQLAGVCRGHGVGDKLPVGYRQTVRVGLTVCRGQRGARREVWKTAALGAAAGCVGLRPVEYSHQIRRQNAGEFSTVQYEGKVTSGRCERRGDDVGDG